MAPDNEGKRAGCFLCTQHASDRLKMHGHPSPVTQWAVAVEATLAVRNQVSEPCSKTQGQEVPQGQGRARGRKPQAHRSGRQGHSLLLTVRKVQIHLELKIDLT